MRKLFLLFFPIFIQAQDVQIGQWKNYLSYNSATYIETTNNKIYCVTDGGLFYIDRNNYTLNRLSKINGLSDIGVKMIAYDNESNTLIITYSNTNIDLIKDNKIINISDIKRKAITGTKKINNIHLNEGLAYLSCSFGLVVLDLNKVEIRDTYKIGNNGDFVAINQCAFNDSSIFAATSAGLYYADKNSNSLFDFNSWQEMGYDSLNITNVINSNTHLIYSYNNGFFTKDQADNIDSHTHENIIDINYTNSLSVITSDTIYIYSSNLLSYQEIYDENIKNAYYAVVDDKNQLWVADYNSGLLKYINHKYQDAFIPEGPASNSIYSLEHASNKLYLCHGGQVNFGALWNKDGASILSTDYDWKNYDYYELGNARDILNVASYKGDEYFASFYNGVSHMSNDEFLVRYSNHNTNGALDTISYWAIDKRMSISDLTFDNNGNLWGLTSSVIHPLFVKTREGEWLSFTMNQDPKSLFFSELIIDKNNQKWGIMGRNRGLFVYNDNNTILNPADDQYKTLSTALGNGNLPSLEIYSIAEDLDGEIWVGTDKGITVFYNPSSVFSGFNFDAQQILIQEGDYGQYLFSEERVKCITIDGANRKWVGTEKSGVFLLSEDGKEEILHFTTDNSPLFSNNIIDITINPLNGEVFIGTEEGLLSYRSDATKGLKTQAETQVFPNPVRENYNGPIAINGLVNDANIKITDIDGNLVFETFANGGQAIWDGKNRNGERASSGVYLVFSVDADGIEKAVSKILFIH